MAAPEIPTTKEINDRIISDIESKIGQSTPLLAKAFNRITAFALSGVFTILYKYGQWVLKQVFTITQDADSLELKGDQYEIPPKDAEAAILTTGFVGDNGTIIPGVTQFRGNANGLLYSLQTTLEIAGGVASGDVLCLTSGETGNLVNGSVITILQPIPGLDNQGTISATVIEGEDPESIEDYRARISEREKTPPQGGSLVDYILWAKEVPGITRAFAWGHREVVGIPAGYISVYPLNDGEASRIPAGGKLTEVQEYIDDPTRAPTQVAVINVPAMTEKVIDIDVSALDPNTAAIRNAFAENVEAYLLEREPQQFIDQLDVKDVISRAGLEAVYIASGAQSVTLTMSDGGIVEDSTLLYNELSILGTITGP